MKMEEWVAILQDGGNTSVLNHEGIEMGAVASLPLLFLLAILPSSSLSPFLSVPFRPRPQRGMFMCGQ